MSESIFANSFGITLKDDHGRLEIHWPLPIHILKLRMVMVRALPVTTGYKWFGYGYGSGSVLDFGKPVEDFSNRL